jgi:hypothetical protein
MASHNVHANPKGVFFKLGLLGETDTLLAGPSNAGLADPGHATALSLVLISSLLLHLYPTLDNNIVMKVIQELGGEIGSALLSAHKKLEADDRVLSGTEEKEDGRVWAMLPRRGSGPRGHAPDTRPGRRSRPSRI